MYDHVVWMDSDYEVAEIALCWRPACLIFRRLPGIFNCQRIKQQCFQISFENLSFQGLTGAAHERKFSIYNYSLVSLTWAITWYVLYWFCIIHVPWSNQVKQPCRSSGIGQNHNSFYEISHHKRYNVNWATWDQLFINSYRLTLIILLLLKLVMRPFHYFPLTPYQIGYNEPLIPFTAFRFWHQLQNL